MTVDEFISKWENCSGSERSNYAVFLTEFARLLEVDAPGPNPDYRVDAPAPGGAEGGGTGFIDLYKRGHFILEAKQSKICELPTLPGIDPPQAEPGGRYDELMRRAFRQARRYAQSLPEPPWPPFIIVLDVGRAFEVYFDYGGNGRDYRFFPDRSSYRIPLHALRDEAVRQRFRAIWTRPKSLDPALLTADVTRKVARRLSDVSKHIEEEIERDFKRGDLDSVQRELAVEEAALFLMRLLFCMFAEDVELLPPNSFSEFLTSCKLNERDVSRLIDRDRLASGLQDLWTKMGSKNQPNRWTFALNHTVRYFNGTLFENRRTFELTRNDLDALVDAATHQWRNVEPSVFGTFLEQALSAERRAQLGAHYTPRPYVERIVEATITDVLRAEWEALEASLEGKDTHDQLAQLRDFHDRLSTIFVLDPACGTGNFLYVAMEALLGLEAKVLQGIEDLGGEVRSRVGPGQFHGLEKNPRAAKIAELVLWIGWLRWRIRNGAGAIEEPILGQRANINFGNPGGYDAVLAQDEAAQPILDQPHKSNWPEADFIVGNPPFIGGKDIRGELGDGYAEAVWKANPDVAPSADFVMQWWDRAATILTTPGTRLRRFGFVTTNSITQAFSRRVIDRHLHPSTSEEGLDKLHLVLACPDHP